MRWVWRLFSIAGLLVLMLHDPAAAQTAGGPGSSGGRGGGSGDGRDAALRNIDAARFDGRLEFVVLGPPGQVTSVQRALEGTQAQVLRRRELPALRLSLLVIDLRNQLNLRQLITLTAQVAPQARADLHLLYRYAAGSPRIYAPSLVGLPSGNACPLRRPVRIGLIDGPVNPAHPALKPAGVVSRSALNKGDRGTDASHGTAVAGLIVGQDRGGALTGFAVGARLYAVSAFAREQKGAGADIERISVALDWLVSQRVRLVNMSFAGPESAAMEVLLAAAARRGAVMVAAAGNDGRNLAAYPAASPNVIAVTAVDAGLRRYRSANYGTHIEFAAPGVDLYVARGGAGSYASGTSYAAPIVTALAARLMARGAGSLSAVRSELRKSAADLGDTGRDPRFGWGLVKENGC